MHPFIPSTSSSRLRCTGGVAASILGTGRGYSKTGGYIKPNFTFDLPPKRNWSQGMKKRRGIYVTSAPITLSWNNLQWLLMKQQLIQSHSVSAKYSVNEATQKLERWWDSATCGALRQQDSHDELGDWRWQTNLYWESQLCSSKKYWELFNLQVCPRFGHGLSQRQGWMCLVKKFILGQQLVGDCSNPKGESCSRYGINISFNCPLHCSQNR